MMKKNYNNELRSSQTKSQSSSLLQNLVDPTTPNLSDYINQAGTSVRAQVPNPRPYTPFLRSPSVDYFWICDFVNRGWTLCSYPVSHPFSGLSMIPALPDLQDINSSQGSICSNGTQMDVISTSISSTNPQSNLPISSLMVRSLRSLEGLPFSK
jgi:hypothetical protein